MGGRKREGQDNIPQENGMIVACNHISAWDPPYVGSAISRELHFFAKKELFEKPWVRWLITRFNAFPVHRERLNPSSLRKLRELLTIGESVLMFPEGTRSKTGEFGQTKPGIGLMAMQAKEPISILPVYIAGTRNIVKSIVYRKGLIIRIGKPITPVDWSHLKRNKDGFRSLSKLVMSRIVELSKH